MAGYIGSKAVSVNTTSATISDDLTVGDDATIAGDATVTGVITGSTVEATGDTAAGDNAAMGYTAAEGLILTGQGSTNDVTIKNDADADVVEIPTGTVNVTMAGNLTIAGSTLKIVDTELIESSDNFFINIQTGNNDFNVQSGGTTFAAFKGSAKDLELTSGNLKIGTAGKGISFSAYNAGTGINSNLLDDYETGTVSLALTGANGNPSTAVAITGTYVKIGRSVNVRVLNTSFNNTGAAGPIALTGFPFASAGAYGIGSIGETNDMMTFTNSPFIVVSGDAGYIYQNISEANSVAVNHHVDAACSFVMNVTYETNA